MSKSGELAELQKRIEQAKLPLHESAKNLVFGKGNPDAPILFIGEAPGAKEDEQGIPFVGAAGKQLDDLLRSIGLTLDDCYIANILKYRPPENRDPNAQEIQTHTPFLVEQIKIIEPSIVATLGNFSTKFVLAGLDPSGMKHVDGISKLHGQPQTVRAGDTSFTVFPLYHPAAMLYRRSLEQTMQSDFVKMGEFLVNTLEKTEHIQQALAKIGKDSQTTLV